MMRPREAKGQPWPGVAGARLSRTWPEEPAGVWLDWPMLARWLMVFPLVSLMGGCEHTSGTSPDLSQAARKSRLLIGQHVPDVAETDASGELREPILRGTPGFGRLVSNGTSRIVFKDEEGTGADRLMTARLRGKLGRLNALVKREWPGVALRVTEAWDEDREHAGRSLHYEGRAADITTSDLDPQKLGRLAGLAVEAGLDWVYYEGPNHVHVSVGR